jgi:hypothetical protein
VNQYSTLMRLSKKSILEKFTIVNTGLMASKCVNSGVFRQSQQASAAQLEVGSPLASPREQPDDGTRFTASKHGVLTHGHGPHGHRAAHTSP